MGDAFCVDEQILKARFFLLNMKLKPRAPNRFYLIPANKTSLNGNCFEKTNGTKFAYPRSFKEAISILMEWKVDFNFSPEGGGSLDETQSALLEDVRADKIDQSPSILMASLVDRFPEPFLL